MMSETLITALVYVLFTSVWQAALCWIFFQLVQFRFPLPASNRYWILLSLICILFISWVANLFYFLHNPSPPTLQLFSISFEVSNSILPNTFYTVITIFYCLGFLYHSFRFVSSFYQLRLLAKHQLPLPAAALSIIREMQAGNPLLSKVAVAATASGSGPLTFGWIQPIILLPIASLNHLSTQEVKSIVLHELAHIRRNDFLHECLIRMMEIVLFFNPFVRLLLNQLREEREKACDDEVIQSGIPVHAYAKALISFAKKDFGQASTPAMAFSGHQPRLLNRIKRLATPEPKRESIPLFSTSLSLIVLFAGLFWMSSHVKTDKLSKHTSTTNAVAVPYSKNASSLTTQKLSKPLVAVSSHRAIPSAQKSNSSLTTRSSQQFISTQNHLSEAQLPETPDGKTSLPIVSVANQPYTGLAKLEQLQRSLNALPDSLQNTFTANAIAKLSPDDRMIWMQALQKLYDAVSPENAAFMPIINRQAPLIVFLNTPLSAPLSGIALQCLTSIREQMEAYYVQNHILFQNASAKDSTRMAPRAAAIQ